MYATANALHELWVMWCKGHISDFEYSIQQELLKQMLLQGDWK